MKIKMRIHEVNKGVSDYWVKRGAQGLYHPPARKGNDAYNLNTECGSLIKSWLGDYYLIQYKADNPNPISERAIKEIPLTAVQAGAISGPLVPRIYAELLNARKEPRGGGSNTKLILLLIVGAVGFLGGVLVGPIITGWF